MCPLLKHWSGRVPWYVLQGKDDGALIANLRSHDLKLYRRLKTLGWGASLTLWVGMCNGRHCWLRTCVRRLV